MVVLTPFHPPINPAPLARLGEYVDHCPEVGYVLSQRRFLQLTVGSVGVSLAHETDYLHRRCLFFGLSRRSPDIKPPVDVA